MLLRDQHSHSLARSLILLKIFEEEAPPSIIPEAEVLDPPNIPPDEVFAADSKTVED